MTVIHEVQQVMMVNSPHGLSQVLFIMDYGIQANSIWICANMKNGKIRHYDSSQLTLSVNYTTELNLNDK